MKTQVKNSSQLALTIKRQASTHTVQRYAANLPAFQIARDLPAPFRDLLSRIERAELRSKR